jgi:hypothetical protein
MFSFSLNVVFLVCETATVEGTVSGSGVRGAAALGRGMRILGAGDAPDGVGGENWGIGGRVEGKGPGGKFWRCHGWSDNLTIFDGLSEFELSVLSGGDGRLGGLISPDEDSAG